MILNPTKKARLQSKSVSPKVTQQFVSADNGYDGLDEVTVTAIPQSPIMLGVSAWVSGATITYNDTTYSSGSIIHLYATETVTLHMPAPGATMVLDGTYFMITGTDVNITLFDSTVIKMTYEDGFYRIDVGSLCDIGGHVPAEYLFLAWEAYQQCLLASPGFGYQHILICETSGTNTFVFLQSGNAVVNYNKDTQSAAITNVTVAERDKSTGLWTVTPYGTGFTASVDLSTATFIDMLLTYNNETIFPTPLLPVVIPPTLPTLNAPTISLSGDTLTITNPATNGNFVTGYKIFSDGSQIGTSSSTTFDLSGKVGTGTHSITAKAYNDHFNDSAASNSVSYTVASGYSVSIGPNASVAHDSYGYCIIDGTTYNFSNYGTGAVLATGASKVRFGSSYDFRYVTYTMGGNQYTTPDRDTSEITLTGDMVILSGSFTCLTGDTLVTMADGTEKRIDEIELGDEILSYDWGTMQLVPNKVIYTDKDIGKTHKEYGVWTFDDGTTVKTVHRHEFFNVEAKRMKYMDEWRIGEHARKIDGTEPALISHETVCETVHHYKITGKRGTNYYANGLLNGDRNCPKEIVF